MGESKEEKPVERSKRGTGPGFDAVLADSQHLLEQNLCAESKYLRNWWRATEIAAKSGRVRCERMGILLHQKWVSDPHTAIESAVLEILGDDLGQAVVLRICPEMRIEPR
jgi:hypothetical protein